MSTEITVGAHTYQIDKLNALDQSDLALELAPTLSRESAGGEPNVAELLGTMSREKRHEIFGLALKCVRRQQGAVLAHVLTKAPGLVLAFQDMTGGELVQLVMGAITHNLANFMPESAPPTLEQDPS